MLITMSKKLTKEVASRVDYQKICDSLLKDLPQKRTKDVIVRRFGFKTGQKETLESIGQSYSITRERVRQIEEDGLKRAKDKIKGVSSGAFCYFDKQLEGFGGLKREDLLLENLGGRKFKPQVLFLLTLGKQFERVSETDDFHSFWTMNRSSLDLAKKTIGSFIEEIKRENKPLALESSQLIRNLGFKAFSSYIEISKKIEKGVEGLYGFFDWPEINPKGIKDKAFLVLKRENKPLHFSRVSQLIQKQEKTGKPSLVKTVHNELIKDERFVLVGRGLYALKEWGYSPGVVKDVIFSVLKEKPLSSEDIVKQVLSQRFVQKNTVLLNLQNKKYFVRNSQGKYTIKEA